MRTNFYPAMRLRNITLVIWKEKAKAEAKEI